MVAKVIRRVHGEDALVPPDQERPFQQASTLVVQGMIAAMEKATAQLPADVKVIPGHGALSNLDDVRAFVKMLKDTSAAVENALKQHKTLEQMKQEKILAPWQKWSGEFITTDAFIETLYNSLTGTKGQFMKHN